nr:GBS Bsp-like repeat-containing protein [uncultured Streptococcus sp.]
MKTKGLVYLASTAILLAASANSVFADETNQAANDRQQTEPSVAVTNRDASKQSEPASKPSEVDSETKKDSGVSEASLGKDEKVASSSSEKEGNSPIEQPKNDLATVPSENISSGRASFRSVTAASDKPQEAETRAESEPKARISRAVDDKPQGTINITNVDPNAGTFDVHVTNISSPKPIKKVALPTWSSVNGQDDIIWYDAKRQVDGTYKISVTARDHKYSTGEYNVHLYYLLEDNQLVGVGGTKTTVTIGKPQGKIDIVNNNPDTGSFDVVVSGVSDPYSVKKVVVPVWSSVNGQDDLVWYEAQRQTNGNYTVTVKASHHKNSLGEYNIHLYYVQDNGQLVGVGGTTTTVSKAQPKGTLKIENNNPDTGSFDVVVSGVSSPYGVKEVRLPTWSSDKGQDDLIWYTAVKQADGTYRATVKAVNHKKSTGEYNVHLYYIQDDGQLVGVGGTRTTVSLSQPKGTLKIENNDPATGSFDVVVSNVSNPFGVKEVKLPTWSNDKGQDDLVWHTAIKQSDGTYRARIQARDHKYSLGDYTVHLYYIQDDGQLVGVAGTQFSLAAKPKGSLKIENNNPNTGSFDVVVSDVVSPFGVKSVHLPIWSSDKGQDDIVWYTATKQSDGTYRASIQARNHKMSTGEYHIHLYYLQDNGQMIGVSGTTTTVSIAKPKGTLTIANNNSTAGSFDVVVSGVSSPEGVREVLLPTWSSTNGQDDIIWYRAVKQADGTYKAQVNLRDHKFSTGEYNIHLYYVQNDGRMVGVGGTKTTANVASEHIKPTGQITIKNNNPRLGTFEVVVTNVYSPKGVKEVSLPTWSSVNGQDDIVWYRAQRQADGSYKALVRTSSHKYSTGEYNIHLYYVQNDGSLVGVGGTTTTVKRGVYDTPYYSQRDPRWAGLYYGKYNLAATGCVPTTLAMTISGITGQTVLPTTVADFLYNHTDSFNRNGLFGTSSKGIVQGAQNWGLTTDVLHSSAALKEALAAGHHVMAAVGNSVFASYPVTHEIVLRGYQNGQTQVYDPYNANNNGWYSVDYIFGSKSGAPEDNTEGSPFISVRA